MPGPSREIILRLYRDALSTPWGFRLQGGKDIKQPLSVQKVGSFLLLLRPSGEQDTCISTHRRRLGGSPGTCTPIIEKRPCIYYFLPPFAPNILVCLPNMFDKSTPVFLPLHIG